MRATSTPELLRIALWAFLTGVGLTGFILCLVAAHLGAEWFSSGWGMALYWVFFSLPQIGVGMLIVELDDIVGGRQLIAQ